VLSRLHKTNSAGELIFAVRKPLVGRAEILVGGEESERASEQGLPRFFFTRWLGNLSVSSLLTNEKRNEWRNIHTRNRLLDLGNVRCQRYCDEAKRLEE
jgi:hypothetical protein